MQTLIEINGVTFVKENVIKMKKQNFMNAFGDEALWEEVQKLKPKSKKKKKVKE